MHAIGVKEGNEVIIPTLTFAATAAVILYFKVLRSVLSGIQVQPTYIVAGIGITTKKTVNFWQAENLLGTPMIANSSICRN